MTTARDIVHQGVDCVPEHETLDGAAQMMRDHHVGSLPVCAADNRLKGIITDRDIVVKCIASGHDPAKMTAVPGAALTARCTRLQSGQSPSTATNEHPRSAIRRRVSRSRSR